jgi:hypothetical protein
MGNVASHTMTCPSCALPPDPSALLPPSPHWDPTASSLDSGLIPDPAITLHCVELHCSPKLTTISDTTLVTAELSPPHFVIIKIIARQPGALEALTATSADSLDPATLHTSYVNAINFAHIMGMMEME